MQWKKSLLIVALWAVNAISVQAQAINTNNRWLNEKTASLPPVSTIGSTTPQHYNLPGKTSVASDKPLSAQDFFSNTITH
jgi:hypothetical protein